MTEVWLRTDEKEDIITSLRMVSASCDLVKSDLAAWKWVVIGTHGAVQSGMVLYLGFGNDLLVARQKDAEEWLMAHEDGAPYPELIMDSFLNLYKKLKRSEILGYRYAPRGTQGRSIKRLNTLRNEFTHFMPRGWSIEMSGMPSICLDCLNVVAELDREALCVRWEDEAQMNTFRKFLELCCTRLETLRDEYKR